MNCEKLQKEHSNTFLPALTKGICREINMEEHKDILQRLESYKDESLDLLIEDAKVEIKRLRNGGCARNQRLTQYCAEAAVLQAEVDSLNEKARFHKSNYDLCCQASETILRQRDQARREVCMILAGKTTKSSYASPDAIAIAEQRRWDCFKDEINP